MRFGPGLIEHFEQCGKVFAVLTNAENRLAAVAVDRLDHNRTVFCHETPHFIDRARHQRRRHEAAVIKHHHLFGRIANIGRIIHDQRFVRDAFEHMGGGDIAHVERRILPHQHYVNVLAEIEPDLLTAREVIALHPLHCHRKGVGEQPVIPVQRQAFNVVFVDGITARLRSQHQRERAIACNVDPVDGVHLDGNAQCHSINSDVV